MKYVLITEASRKAKAARNVYESLRHHRNRKLTGEEMVAEYAVKDGILVRQEDKYRILNLRIHDEYLSPFMKTDMNLFQMLMMDDKADMRMYRAENGWMLVFEGVPAGPKPFGSQGHDMR
ncbi:hypothetical protein LSG31_18190 [Fodinisporobacter ferrooxydans]|uniref:Uncharacterized protein n=1 Tax=Fodinisporobacter ferrooxydans TaxID=2901836 RepID=A0ABY4CH91_9BACL|nr:hypothetical protein LSG31_18190 [Alicyclobacillaceae bacterium MYW30-H2]